MNDELEPRVQTADVADILRRQVNVYGFQLENIADRAGVSMDTVRRVLRLRWPDISLDLADRLLVGAGAHIAEATLIFPDGHPEASDKGKNVGDWWIYGAKKGP